MCSDTCATLKKDVELSSPLTTWREQGLNEVNLNKLYSDDENDLESNSSAARSCSTSDKIGRQRGMRDVVQ